MKKYAVHIQGWSTQRFDAGSALSAARKAVEELKRELHGDEALEVSSEGRSCLETTVQWVLDARHRQAG